MPRFQVTIDVEVQFTSGKFASNDAIADAIQEEIDGGVQLSEISVDEGEYEVTEFDVSVEHIKPVRRRRVKNTKPVEQYVDPHATAHAAVDAVEHDWTAMADEFEKNLGRQS